MSLQIFKVEPSCVDVRLDVFIAQNFPQSQCPSRTYAQRLIAAGQVLVNGKVQKPSYKIQLCDEISASLVLAEASTLVAPEEIPLNIFYEDAWLMIVNKPAGMLVHPVHGHHGGTLVNALMHYCKNLSDVNLPDEDEGRFDPALIRPGIVHRLDRETSGLLVVAKDNYTHTVLARAFERREVQKKYLALVMGNIIYDEGMIDASLGRHPVYRDKKSVVDDDKGKSAVTFYRVIKRFGGAATLVGLFPKSGRTHQLRVHMAHLGHPILGDEKYGRAESFSRMALHAQGLGFYHPHLKGFMEFSTPVPSEFLTINEKFINAK